MARDGMRGAGGAPFSARLRLTGSLWLILVWGLATANPGMAAAGKTFGSIGLQVVPVATGELVVLKAIDGSPALSAAIRPGDLIVEVDGFALAGSNFNEVVPRYLWGAPGSSVSLRYLRPGVTGIMSVTLQRTSAKLPQEAPPGVQLLTPEAPSEARH